MRAVFSRENHAINKELLKKMIREGHPEKSIIEIEEIVEDLFNENKECNKEFRVRNNMIYPFIRIKFNKESIAGVKVGPTNKIDKALLGVSMYLESMGLKNRDVKRSDCPLRF